MSDGPGLQADPPTGGFRPISPPILCPQAANIPVERINHNPVAPTTGEGSDFGFKGDFFRP